MALRVYLKFALRTSITFLGVMGFFQLTLLIMYIGFGDFSSWSWDKLSLVASGASMLIQYSLWLYIYSVFLSKMREHQPISEPVAKLILTLASFSFLIDLLNILFSGQFPKSPGINWIVVASQLKLANPWLSSAVDFYGNYQNYLGGIIELCMPIPFGAASLAVGLLPFYFLNRQIGKSNPGA